jgi:hypothetical protein
MAAVDKALPPHKIKKIRPLVADGWVLSSGFSVDYF